MTRLALLVAYGAMVPMALEVAERVADQGIELPWSTRAMSCPVDRRADRDGPPAPLVVTLEDNGRQGGAGSTLAAALRAAEVDTPLRDIGLPREFLAHGKRAQVHGRRGPVGAGRRAPLIEAVARREPELQPADPAPEA